LLLVSWILERETTEHYRSRMDEMTRASDKLSQEFVHLKLGRLAVQVDRFRYEVRQVEVLKEMREHLSDSRRTRGQKLLKGFEVKQSDLDKNAESQAESSIQNMLDILPALIPEQADTLGKKWDEMMRTAPRTDTL
jgi:hypothetical protein